MPDYRRADVPGAAYFFTVVTHRRRPILCDDSVRSALRYAFTQVKRKRPFTIDACVLLPDHLHCIWTLPENDHAYSMRWSMIKRLVTQSVGNRYGGDSFDGAHGAPYDAMPLDGSVRRAHNSASGSGFEPDGRVRRAHQRHSDSFDRLDYGIEPLMSASRKRRREGVIWQRRFWEHRIRDQADMNRCVDYVHWNPVRHGHACCVAEWPFSTFHRYVRKGVYPSDWGGQGVVDGGPFGE